MLSVLLEKSNRLLAIDLRRLDMLVGGIVSILRGNDAE